MSFETIMGLILTHYYTKGDRTDTAQHAARQTELTCYTTGDRAQQRSGYRTPVTL